MLSPKKIQGMPEDKCGLGGVFRQILDTLHGGSFLHQRNQYQRLVGPACLMHVMKSTACNYRYHNIFAGPESLKCFLEKVQLLLRSTKLLIRKRLCTLDAGTVVLVYCDPVIFMINNILCYVHVYRAYANAIELKPESALFWHDLAVGYLYLGQVASYCCYLIGQMLSHD